VIAARPVAAEPMLARPYPLSSRAKAISVTADAATLPIAVTPPITAQLAGVGAAYGVTTKLTLGASYTVVAHDEGGSFPHDGRFKGALVVHGIYGLAQGRWIVAAGADVTIDLAAETQTLRLGIAARLRVHERVAVFAGEPFGPGPVARQLALSRHDASLALPVGVAFAPNPCSDVFVATDPFGPGAAIGARAMLGRHVELAVRGELHDVRERDVYRITAGVIWTL
jgi:hypothetical protein